MTRFRPQRARSIGLILHYACTFRCGHCLYACRPGLREEVPDGSLDRILDSIRQAAPEADLHLGGGEPFLHMERLVHRVRGIRARGLALEYVETNGFWVRQEDARARLERVRDAGCVCLLLSISPFHNAFLSCLDNRRAPASVRPVELAPAFFYEELASLELDGTGSAVPSQPPPEQEPQERHQQSHEPVQGQ